ncbi:hypothetical protein ACFL3R_00590 [Thermodesulfobacteriota bacterium]
MSTLTIKQNIIYGLGEGASVADTDYLAYALRWANAAYREIFTRYRFKHLRTRAIFRTANGQQTYQAPADFMGLLTLKDETNNTVIDQVTPEEFARDVGTTKIADETFDSIYDTAVSLDNRAIVQYSETICDDADETTTYTRDTDYTMNYTTGAITVDSTGSMADATTYYANYLYYTKSTPVKFCIEYDATNTVYVFRLDPVPDSTYIGSITYPAVPSNLSATVEPIWSQLEFTIERGGIYYGSLEIIEDINQRQEFKQIYETNLQALIQMDQELIPKHDRIPLRLSRTDYTARPVTPLGGRR